MSLNAISETGYRGNVSESAVGHKPLEQNPRDFAARAKPRDSLTYIVLIIYQIKIFLFNQVKSATIYDLNI